MLPQLVGLMRRRSLLHCLVFLIPGLSLAHAQESAIERGAAPLGKVWRWTAGPPLVLSRDLPGISCYSIKDPTVVRHEGQWHLFCTVRGRERSHAVVYLRFADWEDAKEAERAAQAALRGELPHQPPELLRIGHDRGSPRSCAACRGGAMGRPTARASATISFTSSTLPGVRGPA